ncbi:TPA: hypothetical protein QCZ17_004486 [Bacillus cereus]|nr:hypothetical protein [Bacillus cereus]
MKRCIYCNSEKDLTKSHIIPDVLSNGSMKNNNVCEEHNSKFSDSFETYVIEKLSFIANNLDIKSSKANNYPAFTITYSWKDKKYIDDKHTSLNHSLDKIIESTDKTSKIGPNYKVDKIKGQHNIESVVPNDKNLKPSIELDYSVFNSKEMKQLISKIAYEWFCSFNKINNKPQFGKEIRDFILGKTIKNTVKVITDQRVVEAFKNIGNENSHKLISYVDKNNDYCVMIDFWGIIIYQVMICSVSEFPDSIKLFYREQQINSEHVPYSKNEVDELYSDMNIAITDLLNNDELIYESRIREGITLDLKAFKPSEITRKFQFMASLSTLVNSVMEYNTNMEENISLSNELATDNIHKVLSTNVIHLRKIKRVAQSLIIENKKLNTKNIGLAQMPLICILYGLGKYELSDFNQLSLTEVIKKFCDEHVRYDSTFASNSLEVFFNEMSKEMDNDDDCVTHIQKGIEIFK